MKDLPKGILVLKIWDNPCVDEQDKKKVYRKPYVLALEKLEELDRIQV